MTTNDAGAAGSSLLYPNGVDGATDEPLLRIDAATAAQLAQGVGLDPKELNNLHRSKLNSASGGHFGTVAGMDNANLAEARWAVVLNALEDSAVLQALWPLVRHRMAQMKFARLDFDFRQGETAGAWLNRHTANGQQTLATHWGAVPPVLCYRPGETVSKWLARHGVSQGPVEPKRGVPYYLLIAARPGPLHAGDEAFIPFRFQYELDIFWGVGRLTFSDDMGRHRLGDYTAYAEQVVAWEQAARPLRKAIAFFGTDHPGDTATRRSAAELITPLVAWSKTDTVPQGAGITPAVYLAQDATRSNLEKLLSASAPPALLFTASHGIGMPPDHPTLVRHQGALVTADAGAFDPDRGFTDLKRAHWLAGEDLDALAQANVSGMIAFLFACYSAGCPDRDEFLFDEQRQRPVIAPFPLVAQLPQRMLVRGALAVIGHVERAWSYSFTGSEHNTKAQTQAFQDLLGRLLQGKRVGDATDPFNTVQGAHAVRLAEELEDVKFGKIVNPVDLATLWTVRNDARNYMVLGDPAVKLAIG